MRRFFYTRVNCIWLYYFSESIAVNLLMPPSNKLKKLEQTTLHLEENNLNSRGIFSNSWINSLVDQIYNDQIIEDLYLYSSHPKYN